MKIAIDTAAGTAEVEDDSGHRQLDLYSPEAFEKIAAVWLKSGWSQKYSYRFSWLGRPLIQLPEDVIRLQELIWRLQPDVIIETGTAHGGTAVFMAGLCALAGRGRVISVDIEIRPDNRAAIEAHPLADRITLIEGDSIAPEVVERIKAEVGAGETVFVLLDGNHTRAHVTEELEAYAPLVSRDSYIAAADGVMRDLYDVPGGDPSWKTDNPATAAEDFAARHPEFVIEPPPRPFDESATTLDLTYLPSAWLRRRA
jgi:cephalosporin hydroxylase